MPGAERRLTNSVARSARDGREIRLSIAQGRSTRREYQVLLRILNLAVRYDKLHRNRLKGVELPDPRGMRGDTDHS
jgi:hypothetical protein